MNAVPKKTFAQTKTSPVYKHTHTYAQKRVSGERESLSCARTYTVAVTKAQTTGSDAGSAGAGVSFDERKKKHGENMLMLLLLI